MDGSMRLVGSACAFSGGQSGIAMSCLAWSPTVADNVGMMWRKMKRIRLQPPVAVRVPYRTSCLHVLSFLYLPFLKGRLRIRRLRMLNFYARSRDLKLNHSGNATLHQLQKLRICPGTLKIQPIVCSKFFLPYQKPN